jgi:hypothetical protein
VQEDVLRLDVAVHDSPAVRGGERGEDLRTDERHGLLAERRVARDHLAERLAREPLHHHERPAVVELAEVVDLADVRVAHRARGARLLVEALERDGAVAGLLLAEDLDRDELAEREVLGLVHHAHTAAPDHAADGVFTLDRAPDEVVPRDVHARPRIRLYRLMSPLVDESCEATGASPSSSGMIATASCLPSSTPHWSKL